VPKVDKLMAAKETLGKTLWKLVKVVWGSSGVEGITHANGDTNRA